MWLIQTLECQDAIFFHSLVCWLGYSFSAHFLCVRKVCSAPGRVGKRSEPRHSLGPFCKPAHHPVRRMEQGRDEAAKPPVAQLCPTLCDPMDCSTPGSPVLHHLPEFAQTQCPSSRWCHPTTSSSVVPFLSCLQSFPASRSLPMSRLFASGGQSIGASASALPLPMNIQGWFPLGLILGRLSDTLFTHFSWGFGFIHGLFIQFEQDNWSKITVGKKLYPGTLPSLPSHILNFFPPLRIPWSFTVLYLCWALQAEEEG